MWGKSRKFIIQENQEISRKQQHKKQGNKSYNNARRHGSQETGYKQDDLEKTEGRTETQVVHMTAISEVGKHRTSEAHQSNQRSCKGTGNWKEQK